MQFQYISQAKNVVVDLTLVYCIEGLNKGLIKRSASTIIRCAGVSRHETP